MSKIHTIVLTGGPCGGKSTGMSVVSDRLRSLGFNVLVVPEAATMMILGGIQLVPPNTEHVAYTQACLMNMQLMHERMFRGIAALSDKPSVILCDRGIMDGSAFCPPNIWQAILDEHGWTNVGLRDKHYDAVIHLVTAAIGAKEHYTLENNAARSETPEQAAKIDELIQNVWVGHPHLRVIDNSTNFEEKIRRVTAAVCNVVGVPEPVECERKFLVKQIAVPPVSVKTETVLIEQTYLNSDNQDEIARVRKRSQNGTATYTHTIKRHTGTFSNIEIERMISGREYLALLQQADSSRIVVEKQRTCFLWKNQYFELDEFIQPQIRPILEVEIDAEDQQIELPPWIAVECEVTGKKEFSNAEIARQST
jgi:CYTH domain-containing protein/thymidylate kinase